MTLLGAALVGVAIGVVLGALGGGGGILTVPVLAYGFGLAMHEASAASLVIVGLSSATALVAHARAGRVDWRRGTLFAAFGIGGAVAGSLLARGLDPTGLMIGFGALLIVVAALMLRGRRAPAPAPAAPADLRAPRTLAATAATGLGVGVLTGFFGVGGGFAIVPALTLVLGMPMPAAVATSLLVIVLNGVAALTTKLAVGVVLDVPLVAAFTVATMAGSLLGTRVTGRADPALLRRAFAGLLLVVAAFTLLTSLASLAP